MTSISPQAADMWATQHSDSAPHRLLLPCLGSLNGLQDLCLAFLGSLDAAFQLRQVIFYLRGCSHIQG